MSQSKTPTIAQLLKVIEAYNKAHELDMEEVARGLVDIKAGNPLLEHLYFAAANAAKALAPLMKVELSTKPISRTVPPRLHD